jgi:5-methylcytosine-specific restriction endonuclease McrA
MRKPLHPCAEPGCGQLIRYGNYCPLHDVKSHAARGKYGRRWQTCSKEFLKRNPFCADPWGGHPGAKVVATVVGHRIAFKSDERLKWNPANHYPLCGSCNSYQCAKFEGGFGNRAEKTKVSNQQGEPTANVRNEYPPSVYTPPGATTSDGEPTTKVPTLQ